MKELELYLHIPFCIRKCAYCDFASAPANEAQKEAYIEALCQEIRARRQEGEGYVVRSVFFGGGTPSVIRPDSIAELLDELRSGYQISETCEITMEANPGTVTKESLSIYRRTGINRLGFGLQSCHNEELKLLGRIHTFEEFLESFRLAREAGFDNINVDLMSALPGQTPQSFRSTLEQVVSLQPEHISAYSLIIEEGTPFYEKYHEDDERRAHGEENTGILPSEDAEREMYEDAERFLGAAGFIHYEISNYAKPGRECVHNIGYWDGTEYLGFGVSAASYINRRRTTNVRTTEQYLEAFRTGKAFSDPTETEEVTKERAMEEFMFLGLRMLKGVSEDAFAARFGVTMETVYGEVLRNLQKEGLLVRESGRVCLSVHGMDLANYCMAQFLT